MSAVERIMSQWEVAVGTPPDHEECQGAWLELVCLSKRNKSIVKSMKRRQTAEHQGKALVISSESFFTFAGGMDGTGGISSLEAVTKHLKERLNAIVGGL